MTKLANGFVNEKNIDAVVKSGANWEIVMSSGARFVVSEEDAAEFLPDPPKGSSGSSSSH
jgi:hypothetical protein